MSFIFGWQGVQSKEAAGRRIGVEYLPLLVMDDHRIVHSLKCRFELVGTQNRFTLSHQCSYTGNLTLARETGNDDAGQRMTPARRLSHRVGMPGDEVLKICSRTSL